MGYATYKRIQHDSYLQLIWEEDISLAGYKSGLIVRELRSILKPIHNPYIGWTLPIADKFNENGLSVIIDIKPKGKEIFLCELDTVFGFCYKEWTPIMFRLRRLFSDLTNEEIDKYDFAYPNLNETDIIYTMLYLSGSINNGQIEGTWNFPGPSSTNALLFWSQAMTFFHKQVEKFDPDFLHEDFNMIQTI